MAFFLFCTIVKLYNRAEQNRINVFSHRYISSIDQTPNPNIGKFVDF
jgi:hypothetical protein